MEPTKPLYYESADECVERLIRTVGKKIVLAAPLALAKPNHLINALYRRAKQDPDLHFTLITAVSLEKPSWSNELEKRYLHRRIKPKEFAFLQKFGIFKQTLSYADETACLCRIPETAGPYLERMGLDHPSGIKEKLMQKVVLSALKISGQL